jgi:hypothetical protein
LIKSLIRGAIHGEINEKQPNEKAKKFFQLLQEAKKELFPGCTEAAKVSFIVKMFQLKCMFGCSNACLEFVLHLFLLILPDIIRIVPIYDVYSMASGQKVTKSTSL